MSSNSSSLSLRSISAVKWNYLGVVARVAMQLVVQITLARVLGPESMGVFALIFLVIGVGSIFVEMGLGAALVQRSSISEDEIRVAFTWTVLLGVLVGLTVLSMADYISIFFDDPGVAPVLRGISPVFFFQALSVVPLSLLRRDILFKKIQYVQIGSYFIGFLVVGLGSALAGFGVWSLVAAWLVQSILSAIAYHSFLPIPKKPLFSSESKLYQFGVKVVFANLANWVVENVDNFLVGNIFGAKSLGLYSVSYNLVRTPANHLVVTLQSVLFPASARAQSSEQNLRRIYLVVVSAVALVAAPAFLSVAVVSDTVVEVLFGVGWLEAAPILIPLSLAMIPHALMAVAGPVLWGRGKVSDELVVQGGVAVLLVVSISSTSSYSVLTTAWAVFCVYVVRFLAITFVLLRRLSICYGELLCALKGAVASGAAVALLMLLVEVVFGDLTAVLRFFIEFILATLFLLTISLLWPRFFFYDDLLLFLGGVLKRSPRMSKCLVLRRLVVSSSFQLKDKAT